MHANDKHKAEHHQVTLCSFCATDNTMKKKIMSYTIKSNKHMNVYNADPGMLMYYTNYLKAHNMQKWWQSSGRLFRTGSHFLASLLVQIEMIVDQPPASLLNLPVPSRERGYSSLKELVAQSENTSAYLRSEILVDN